jgi:glycosyltransferase involved in cell wall biosynthesis
MHSLVSVIIPAYNSERTLAEAINSALNQSYEQCEIIVIDDGSTDGTAELVQKFQNDKFRYFKQPNQGLASARNKGHELAQGKYIAWLDADDRCHPDRIAIQLSCLERMDGVVLISTNYNVFDRTGIVQKANIGAYYETIEKYFDGLNSIYTEVETLTLEPLSNYQPPKGKKLKILKGQVRDQLMVGNFVHPPTVMFRKEIIAKTGILRTDLRNVEDYEFFLRMSKFGKMAFLDLPLLDYRISDSQSSKNIKVNNTSLIKLREELVKASPCKFQKTIRHKLGINYSMLAQDCASENTVRAFYLLSRALQNRCGFPLFLKSLLFLLVPAKIREIVKRALLGRK